MNTSAEPRTVPVKGIRSSNSVSPFPINSNTPKCSSSILSPIKTSTKPPAASAPDLYLVPKTLPIFTPSDENKNVVIHMMRHAKNVLNKEDALKSFTGTATNVIPTASASIEVATASKNIFLTSNPALASSSSFEKVQVEYTRLPPGLRHFTASSRISSGRLKKESRYISKTC